MRIIAIALTCTLTLVLTACGPLEEKTRDTAAALSGSIVAAQSKYHDGCVANPTKDVCQLINKGVSGENALITALETYCGWQVNIAPPDPKAKCVPVKSAQSALEAALANAAILTTQIKGVI